MFLAPLSLFAVVNSYRSTRTPKMCSFFAGTRDVLSVVLLLLLFLFCKTEMYRMRIQTYIHLSTMRRRQPHFPGKKCDFLCGQNIRRKRKLRFVFFFFRGKIWLEWFNWRHFIEKRSLFFSKLWKIQPDFLNLESLLLFWFQFEQRFFLLSTPILSHNHNSTTEYMQVYTLTDIHVYNE